MRNLRPKLPIVIGINFLVIGPTIIFSPLCKSSEPRECGGQRSFKQRGPTEIENLQFRMHRLTANLTFDDVARLFSLDVDKDFEGGIHQVRAQFTRDTSEWKVGQTYHLTIVIVEIQGKRRLEGADLKMGQKLVASWRANK